MLNNESDKVNRKDPKSLSSRDVLSWATRMLAEHAIESPRQTALELMAFGAKMSKNTLLTEPNRLLNAGKVKKIKQLLRLRSQHIPLQYILGSEYFCDLHLQVGPGVLIPRPETELIVSAAKNCFQQGGLPEKIVDLGTGSGNLALALSRLFPQALVWGVDQSRRALFYARKNRQTHKLSRVRFFWGDAEQPLPKKLLGHCDLVVSNPPYIPLADLPGLQAEVRFEPRKALAGGADGLQSIKRMLQGAFRLLRPEGYVILEIGIHQAPLVKAMFVTHGFRFNHEVYDWQQIPRILIAQKIL